MVFKVNIAQKGKTHKLETESETLIGKKIGETFKGEDIDASLKGFELEITGTSDLSGIPGFKGLEGDTYHRKLLTKGPGMHDKRKGVRLRKTNRGEMISAKTRQINTIVKKEGEKKFEDLLKGIPEETSNTAEEPKVDKKADTKAPAETPKEEEEKPAPAEAPKEEKKE